MLLFYGDDREYAVELFDRVDVYEDGRLLGEGEVRAIHARAREVTVSFAGIRDTTRSGDPRRKTRRLPVAQVDFMGRDG
jgi:hypothetical protein